MHDHVTGLSGVRGSSPRWRSRASSTTRGIRSGSVVLFQRLGAERHRPALRRLRTAAPPHRIRRRPLAPHRRRGPARQGSSAAPVRLRWSSSPIGGAPGGIGDGAGRGAERRRQRHERRRRAAAASSRKTASARALRAATARRPGPAGGGRPKSRLSPRPVGHRPADLGHAAEDHHPPPGGADRRHRAGHPGLEDREVARRAARGQVARPVGQEHRPVGLLGPGALDRQRPAAGEDDRAACRRGSLRNASTASLKSEQRCAGPLSMRSTPRSGAQAVWMATNPDLPAASAARSTAGRSAPACESPQSRKSAGPSAAIAEPARPRRRPCLPRGRSRRSGARRRRRRRPAPRPAAAAPERPPESEIAAPARVIAAVAAPAARKAARRPRSGPPAIAERLLDPAPGERAHRQRQRDGGERARRRGLAVEDAVEDDDRPVPDVDRVGDQPDRRPPGAGRAPPSPRFSVPAFSQISIAVPRQGGRAARPGNGVASS